MDFVLTGIGVHLTHPLVEHLRGATLAAARRNAYRILDAYGACEAVEIFSAGRFIAEVKRRPATAQPAPSRGSLNPWANP